MKLRIILIIILGLFISFSVYALLAPQVFITNVVLSKTTFKPEETINGQISLWNYENYLISDLIFHFLLIKKGIYGTTEEIIDKQIGKENIVLFPNEETTKTFSYTLPKYLPEGSYTFRAQLANLKGETMGWFDVDINIESENKFLLLNNYWILKNSSLLNPGAGVYYQPGETPKVIFDVNNLSNINIQAFYRIITYKRNVSDFIADQREGSNLVFQPKEKRTLEIELPKLTQPESYLSEIRFYNTEDRIVISNPIYFRWIISGQDAEILYSKINKGSFKKGEEAEVQIQIAGPADYNIKGGDALMEVILFDDRENIVGKKLEKIVLQANEITVKIPIEKDAENVKVLTQIMKDNKILDKYEFKTPVPRPGPADQYKQQITRVKFLMALLISLIILFLIIRGIIYFLVYHK